MVNPEKLATLDTQNAWPRQAQQKHNIICIEHPIHKTQGEENNLCVTQNRASSHVCQKAIN
jgi:hypothetical protein